jgi:hypothetical protein
MERWELVEEFLPRAHSAWAYYYLADNASTDDSLQWLAVRPAVNVIAMDSNPLAMLVVIMEALDRPIALFAQQWYK